MLVLFNGSILYDFIIGVKFLMNFSFLLINMFIEVWMLSMLLINDLKIKLVICGFLLLGFVILVKCNCFLLWE